MRKWLTERKEYWQPSPDEFRAFLVSFVFLILGFLTLIIIKSVMNVGQDLALVAIFLLAPVLIFLVLSGKLLEINAGGLSAKFNEVAQKSLFDEGNAPQIDEVPTEVIMKKSLAQLPEILQIARNTQYIILTMTFRKDRYERSGLLKYLRALTQYQNFTLLAILEENEKLFGYITGWQAIQILELEKEMTYHSGPGYNAGNADFVCAINEGSRMELRRYPLITETVKPTDTNISALRKMAELKTSVLMVADDNRLIRGVVEREQVLSKLMLALTKS